MRDWASLPLSRPSLLQPSAVPASTAEGGEGQRTVCTGLNSDGHLSGPGVMETSDNNNKYDYLSFSGTLPLSQSQLSPGTVRGTLTDGGDGCSPRPPALHKSKKSLNSIVARLSNQSQPRASRQFMAALSLTERVTSQPQPGPPYAVNHTQPAPVYEVNHAQPAPAYEMNHAQLVYRVNQSNFSPVYEVNHNQISVVDDVALDLSLKKPTRSSHSMYGDEFHEKTDSCGALDLSVSGQRGPMPESSTGSPDFVLDLTQSPAYSVGSGERSRPSTTGAERGKPPPSNTRNGQELSRETFRENHRRVLQYLKHHTITQRIAGPDVDIELLTCRYCKYASTEKSSMMTHLSTAHHSKRRGSRQPDKTRTGPHQQNASPHQQNASRKQVGQHVASNLVIPQYKKRGQHPGVSPPFPPGSRVHKQQFQQLSQLAEDGSLKFFPSPSVNLSPLEKQDREALMAQSRPISGPANVRTPQSARKPSPSPKNGGRGDGEYALPANHVAYLGEDGRIYLLPHSSPGSTLEERLTPSQSDGSSTNQPVACGPTSATMNQTFSGSGGISAPAEDMQRQLKLNHLCKKLAKRMDKQKSRPHPHDFGQQPRQGPIQKRRRKSSTGKRQHLITQTGTFSCEYCPKTFKRPLSLYGHLKQHSPLLKKHRKGRVQCPACTLAFTDVQELLQHVRENHSTLSDLDSVRRETKAQLYTGLGFQGIPTPPVEVNSVRKEMQESGGSEDRPYSLRDKARRDYLLDNDPMNTRLVYPVEHHSSQENEKLPHSQGREPLDANSLPRVEQSQTSENTAKRTQSSGGKLTAVQSLLKLRRTSRRKEMRHHKNKSSRLGRTWKALLRKSRTSFNFHQLDKVLRSFTRTTDGLRCNACHVSFRPPWKAVLHLKTSHMPLRKEGKGKRSSTKAAMPEGHKSLTAPVTGSSKLGENVFVKVEGDDEKFQCNLCLQIFQGRESLTDHLEMHKEIYEAGVQSFSENDPNQDLDKKVDSTSAVAVAEEPCSSHFGSGVNPETSSDANNSTPKKAGTVLHNSLQTNHTKAMVSDLPNTDSDASPNGLFVKKKNGSPSRPKPSKSDGQLTTKSRPAHFQRLACKICKYATFGMEEIKRHLKKHSKTLLTCDQCSYQTIEKRLIVRHIQTVHEQKRPYTCELCVYSTAYKHHLKRHYKSHSVDLLTCPKCSFCTLQESKLQEHMKEHDLSPNIVMCDDCGLTFASSKMLAEHLEETKHQLKSGGEESPPENGSSSSSKERSGFAANWWENLPMTAIDEEAIIEHYCCHSCGFIADSSDGLMSHMVSEHLEMRRDFSIEVEKQITSVPHLLEESTDVLHIAEEPMEVLNTWKETLGIRHPTRESPDIPHRLEGSSVAPHPKVTPDVLQPRRESPDILHPRKGSPIVPNPEKQASDFQHLKRKSPDILLRQLGSPVALHPKNKTADVLHPNRQSHDIVDHREGSPSAPRLEKETSDFQHLERKSPDTFDRQKGSAMGKKEPLDVPLLKRESPDTLYRQRGSPIRKKESVDVPHLERESPATLQRRKGSPVAKKETPDVPHLQRLNRLAMDLCQCPQCGFITSRDQLRAHLETHNASEETYACEHCPFETKELETLQAHKSSRHVKHEVSLTCALCGEVQTDVLSLRDHTRIHLITVAPGNPFRCSLCPFVTESMGEGEYHLDQHNYVMEFKCQVCMYSSPTLSGMTSHRKLHRRMHTSTHIHKARASNGKLSVQAS